MKEERFGTMDTMDTLWRVWLVTMGFWRLAGRAGDKN